MIAGDPTKRSFSGSIEQKQITHMCIGKNDDDRESYPLPDHECQNGLRTQVFFPSCWTGKDVDTPDHKSHVAYPSLGYDGDCPETHPVRLISIFYEIMWDTVYDDLHPDKNDFPKEWWVPEGATQPFVLSNGDPTGYGFHGDFINGWDVDKLQAAADHCLAPSGVIQDCPLLELRTDYEKTECLQVPRVADETVGWVDRLPGCNPITSGPADAPMIPPSACGATTEIISKDSQQVKFPFISPVEGWTILGCAPDDINARVMSSERYANGAMTPKVCAAYCQEHGFGYAGVEYGSECFCDHAFDQSLLTARKCDVHCDGDSTVNCGGNARLAVYQRGVAPLAPAQASDTSTSQASPNPASTEPTHGPLMVSTRGQDVTQLSVLRPGWEKVGCYIDTVKSRLLSIGPYTDGDMTPQLCISHCEEESYLYAGTEWAKECWCADDLPDDAQKANDMECDTPCAGNARLTCGGSLRAMIYWDADLDSDNDDEDCVDALDGDGDGTSHDGPTNQEQCEDVEKNRSISMQPPSMRSLRNYLRAEQGNSSLGISV
ncbi:WSC-domain-containing protein [Exidia glandulosa HHB12029]|uniref:WSC-domain-containing protein n=1 Tax=Exidia glandulosa HHB12029 TaxID=1314781 RepID=A0A165CT52_EXIGL|nr:WSC-domain-containing protein [Exidia glandulosa HHB12029]